MLGEIFENLMYLLFSEERGLAGFGFDVDLFDERVGLFLSVEFLKLECLVGTDIHVDCLSALINFGGNFLY
jgi:hypothetical protein